LILSRVRLGEPGEIRNRRVQRSAQTFRPRRNVGDNPDSGFAKQSGERGSPGSANPTDFETRPGTTVQTFRRFALQSDCRSHRCFALQSS
jgi:hypothetical protein